MDDELKRKANNLFYFIGKTCARESWNEFREGCDVSEDEWKEIKAELAKIGITNTYT